VKVITPGIAGRVPEHGMSYFMAGKMSCDFHQDHMYKTYNAMIL
jgi:hypothetical protein